MRLGFLGKPSFLATLFLLEELTDAPKAGGSQDTMNSRQKNVLYQECRSDGGESQNEKYPPVAGASVVFGLDDNRVEESYNEKCADGNDDACEM